LRAYRALNADWEEAKKYAPIALVKEYGGFDVGSSNGSKNLFRPKKRSEKFSDIIGGFPGFMDKVGWTSIWRAVRREVAEDHKVNAKDINEAFMEKYGQECADRFTEIIHKSQVYDSVFSRSELMRSKSQAAQILTMFKGESTKILTMTWTTYIEALRLKKSEGIIAASKKIVSFVAAFTLSQALNSALKSLVNAGMDDDEDETWTEKYIQAFADDFDSNTGIDGFLQLFPGISELVSKWNGYRLKRIEFALFENLIDSIQGFDNERKSETEKWMDLAFSVSALLGFPAENVYKDTQGIANSVQTIIKDVANKDETTFAEAKDAFMEGWTGEDQSKKEPKESYSERAYAIIAEFEEGNNEEAKKRIKSLVDDKRKARKGPKGNPRRTNVDHLWATCLPQGVERAGLQRTCHGSYRKN